MLTEESIKAAIAIEDLKVTPATEPGQFWATLSRREKGHHYSRSKRIMPDTTEEQLQDIGAQFHKWWDNE